MTRFLPLFFAGLLSVLSVALFVSSSASAASIWDNSYRVRAEGFEISRDGACTSRDITSSIFAILDNRDNWPSHYSTSDINDYLDYARETMGTSGSSWGASHYTRWTTENIKLYYFKDGANFNFISNEGGSGNHPIRAKTATTGITFSISLDSNCEYQVDGGPALSSIISNNNISWDSNITNIFAYNFDITWPAGYDGDELHDTPPVVLQPLTYWVNAKFSNALTDFKANYLNYNTDPSPSDIGHADKLIWYLIDPSITDVQDAAGWQSVTNYNTNIQHEYPDRVIPYIFDHGGFKGDYICSAILDLNQEFNSGNCKKFFYSPDPAKLSQKQYLLVVLPYQFVREGYDITSKNTVLNIDFSKVVSDFSSEQCIPGALGQNDAVWCAQQDDYEDCLAYGVDLVGGIGCHVRNLGTFIVSALKLLFVPELRWIEQRLEYMTNNMKTALGFIWAPVDFIIQIFTTVKDISVANNTCALPPLTFFGSTATVHLCQWRYQLPGLWAVMQLAIQGGIALSLIFVFWRTFMKLFGHDTGDDESEFDTDTTSVNVDSGKERHTQTHTIRRRIK